MLKKFFYSFLIVIFYLLGACKPTTVLTDDSCQTPCWKNITPGITTITETVSILSDIPEIKYWKYKEKVYFNPYISWKAIPFSGDFGGEIHFREGVVYSLGFILDDGAMNLEDAIQKFGQPESLLLILNRTEINQLIYYIFYPTKGVVVVYVIDNVPDTKYANLNPKQHVQEINYLNPENLFEALTNGAISYMSDEMIEIGLQQWKGYGIYPYNYLSDFSG